MEYKKKYLEKWMSAEELTEFKRLYKQHENTPIATTIAEWAAVNDPILSVILASDSRIGECTITTNNGEQCIKLTIKEGLVMAIPPHPRFNEDEETKWKMTAMTLLLVLCGGEVVSMRGVAGAHPHINDCGSVCFGSLDRYLHTKPSIFIPALLEWVTQCYPWSMNNSSAVSSYTRITG